MKDVSKLSRKLNDYVNDLLNNTECGVKDGMLDEDYPMRGGGIRSGTLGVRRNLKELQGAVLNREVNEERLCKQWAGEDGVRKKCFPKNDRQEVHCGWILVFEFRFSIK